MTQPTLLGLCGYARSGKDTLAAPFAARGFINLAFGAVIKGFFDPYTKGEENARDLVRRMQYASPALGKAEIDEFCKTVLLPFEEHDLVVTAFTEEDNEKQALRPILERGGELIYDYIFREYFRRVDAAWSAGKSVVNTRIVRPEEALEWKRRGGIVYLVERANWSPATAWEREQMEALKLSGLMDATLHNDGTAAEWNAYAEQLASAMSIQFDFEEAAFRR